MRRRRRWPVRVCATVGALVGLTAVAAGLAVVATPSVSSAPQKVSAILAAHNAPSDQGAIPVRVAAALLATEDSRYWSGPALDMRGALRAGWGLAISNPNYGGATIEVQLAKLLYTPGRSDVAAMAEQAALAVKLDGRFTKRQILAMYLDAAYFGDGAYGITAASQHYFGLLPGRLSWGQAALLAGLVQAPSRFDPHGHLSAALQRRSQVLHRLVVTGQLTSAQQSIIERQALAPAIGFSG